jgi:rod shape-determining protein MreD
VAFLLQSLLFQDIRIFSCSPDITLALLAIFAVSLDFVPAACLGAFAGLLTDVMYEQVFGINFLIYMFFALFVSL